MMSRSEWARKVAACCGVVALCCVGATSAWAQDEDAAQEWPEGPVTLDVDEYLDRSGVGSVPSMTAEQAEEVQRMFLARLGASLEMSRGHALRSLVISHDQASWFCQEEGQKPTKEIKLKIRAEGAGEAIQVTNVGRTSPFSACVVRLHRSWLQKPYVASETFEVVWDVSKPPKNMPKDDRYTLRRTIQKL